MAMSHESATTLKSIGFSTDTANEIWTHYLASDPASPYDLMDNARCYIEGSRIKGLSDRAALIEMGLSTDFQERFLKPDFFAIRRTRGVRFWVLEFLDCNFKIIGALQKRSQNDGNRNTDSSQHGGRSSKPFESEVGSSKAASSARVARGTPVITVTGIENILNDRSLHYAHVEAVPARPQQLPGHITLYQAIPGAKCESWIRYNGSIDVVPLAPSPGGDFNGRDMAYYWTRELETAERYRDWLAQNILEGGDIWIISLQIPAALSTDGDLKYTKLKYSNPWKHYVWRCKNLLKPREQEEEISEADIIHGHICTQRNKRVLREIAEADIENSLTRAFLLMNRNEPATQDCVMNEGAMKRIFERAGGVHVDVIVVKESRRCSKGRPR